MHRLSGLDKASCYNRPLASLSRWLYGVLPPPAHPSHSFDSCGILVVTVQTDKLKPASRASGPEPSSQELGAPTVAPGHGARGRTQHSTHQHSLPACCLGDCPGDSVLKATQLVSAAGTQRCGVSLRKPDLNTPSSSWASPRACPYNAVTSLARNPARRTQRFCTNLPGGGLVEDSPERA